MIIVDAQGFVCGKEFLIRELSIKTEKLCLTFNVDTGLNFNLMTQNDYMTNKYCLDKVHGLSLRPSMKHNFISQSDAIAILRQFSLRLDEPLLIKNNQLATLLGDNNISYCELETPRIKDLYSTYKDLLPACKNHYKFDGNCSKKKVVTLFHWFIEHRKIDDILNSADE